MNPLELLHLQPQDKVVVLEKEHDRTSSPWIERTYYVEHVERGDPPRIHIVNEWGFDAKTVSLADVVDIEKVRHPITGIVDPDIWKRFHGDPAYEGRAVRLIMASLYEGRISGYKVPLWPDGNRPAHRLGAIWCKPYQFVELGVTDEKHAITSMPAYGAHNKRAGDPETLRRRIYRTARNRITQVLHGAKSKWRRGAIDEEPA